MTGRVRHFLACWLFGHADGAPIAFKSGTVLAVRCARCQRISAGIAVPVTAKGAA